MIYKTKLSNLFRKFFKVSYFGLSMLSMLTLVGCCRTTMTGILNPTGVITYQERQLFFDSLALMLIIVIPVFIITFTFIVCYRATRTLDYQPNWGHSVLLEVVWWGIPMAIIFILGLITWTMSHKLDPYRTIKGGGKPMVIQVVALPWKWLFIYPEQNLATINYLEIARGRQVEFMLTSDNVPMSAFFIPQLGSQIYTMAGMRTRLHLIPLKDGIYEGIDSQYNGDGFSDMYFNVKVVEPNELQHWFSEVRGSNEKLTPIVYQKLIQPSIKEPIHYYSSVTSNLFSEIIMKYMQTTRAPIKWESH